MLPPTEQPGQGKIYPVLNVNLPSRMDTFCFCCVALCVVVKDIVAENVLSEPLFRAQQSSVNYMRTAMQQDL